MTDQFPHYVYKGSEPRIVSSRGEETEALANGWRLQPFEEDAEPQVVDGEVMERPRRGRPPKLGLNHGGD